MKKLGQVMMVLGLMAGVQVRAVSDEYWRTDGTAGGTWISTYWNPGSANATGGTGWTSGNNAVFSANSTLTFATATIGNVTVSNSAAVTITAGGTLTLGGVRTFDVESGSTLTWSSQTQSTAAGNEGAGIIKNGAGTMSLGSGGGSNVRYDGGFTLNAGTVIVSGKYALSTGPLTFNGGTLQSSGSLTYNTGAITIGGSFAFAGTGSDDYTNSISLGATTSTITNSTSATSAIRILGGVISGNAGTGLSFTGSGSGTINITNANNSFTGPITINGGEVQFANDGSFGATPGSAVTNAIIIDGGRLTSADGAQSAVSYTLNANRGIQVGATAGTSISVKSGTGLLTYNGIIADETGATGILVKQGAGTLALGGVSIFSGTMAINNGTVQLTSGDNRLPTGTTVSLGQSASANLGKLDLNGNNQQIAGLNSTAGSNATANKNMVTNSSATASTLTIGGSGTYAYGDGSAINSGIIGGAISVVMSGSGSQTLGDANSYTGGTQINNGILALNNSGTLGTGNIGISSSGTLDVTGLSSGYTLGSGSASVLTNYGTVAGGLIISSGALVTGGGHFSGSVTNQAGGMLTPGVGGDTNYFSSLTLNGGSTNSFYVASLTKHDMSVVTNGVIYGGDHPMLNLNLTDWTAPASTGTLVLYDDLSGSAWDGISQTFQLADGGSAYDGQLLTNGASFLALGGGSTPIKFTMQYNVIADGDSNPNDIGLTYTVIPEPTSMSLMAMLGAVYLMRQRILRPRRRPYTP